MEIKAGFAKRDITPDLNGDFGDFYIAGYATMEAPKVTGIHDPIFARVMVLSDGNTKIALISLEIVGMLIDFGNQVRYRLDAYGFLPKNVFIFATHTHAGSDTLSLYGPLIGISGINKKYILFMIEMIVEAVCEAENNMSPVSIYHAYSTRNDLIENFRNPEMM
ncbi:MAG: neutral/alkaline non-lysosomal ceramidase N-terminal domain-containing protein, partial [Promethearchaeota archaeon]